MTASGPLRQADVTGGSTPAGGTRGTLVIRSAGRRDAPTVGRILAAGLAEKYGPAYGRRAVAAITAIARADADASDRDGYLIAELDGTAAGVAYLGTGGRHASVARPLASALGPLRAIRALLVLTAFSKGTTAADEAALDELAVDVGFRRRGVGAALIEECVLWARESGQRRLSLWVTGENAGAQALYSSCGFRVVERRRWPSGRLLFGSRGALKMERELDSRG